VETREDYGRKDPEARALGDSGRPAVSYEIDAFHDVHGVVVDVEAGRGARGNGVYRDIVRTSLILDAHYRALLLPVAYRHQSGGREVARSGSMGARRCQALTSTTRNTGCLPPVSRVAATLNVDQPRASKLVAAAVETGLVRREADQTDGRRAPLVRTERGNALFEELHRFRCSIFATAMSDWTEADRAAFARLLTRFVESLAGITGSRGIQSRTVTQIQTGGPPPEPSTRARDIPAHANGPTPSTVAQDSRTTARRSPPRPKSNVIT
jgi:DNA-binding MarR family transcriptional regulator